MGPVSVAVHLVAGVAAVPIAIRSVAGFWNVLLAPATTAEQVLSGPMTELPAPTDIGSNIPCAPACTAVTRSAAATKPKPRTHPALRIMDYILRF